MYHPDAFLTVAHTREAELVREAAACGFGQKPGTPARRVARRLVVLAPVAAMLAVGLAWLAG